ncbi:hypothetical protein [Reichenbachiella sp.]|uniref:hypothetical protein n=1 Tax=Reichenbachiella sp. TaxID=2184521 RepID=UPI003B5CF296
MDNVDFSNINLGMTLSPDYPNQVQKGTDQKLAAIMKALTNESTDIVIIHGCEFIIDGDDYAMTAGAAYYNGQVYTVQAFNQATAPGGQVPVFVEEKVYDRKAWYGDNLLRDTFYSNTLKLQFGASDSGIADYDEVVQFSDKLGEMANVVSQFNAIIDGAPAALDTLNELAAALGDDPNYAATIATQLAERPLKHTTINIPSWNMSLAPIITIATGLSSASIVYAVAGVRDDANSYTYYGHRDLTVSKNGTDIVLARATGGTFTGADFDGTGFNRGQLIVWHT